MEEQYTLQSFWSQYIGGILEIQVPGMRKNSLKGWARKPWLFKGIIRDISIESLGTVKVTSKPIVGKGNDGDEVMRVTELNPATSNFTTIADKLCIHGHSEPRFPAKEATVYLMRPEQSAAGPIDTADMMHQSTTV